MPVEKLQPIKNSDDVVTSEIAFTAVFVGGQNLNSGNRAGTIGRQGFKAAEAVWTPPLGLR